jgi:hypothetical protein
MIQQVIANHILCVLFRIKLFLKKMPAPMHAPMTTTMHDRKPNCFFLGKFVMLDVFFVEEFCCIYYFLK